MSLDAETPTLRTSCGDPHLLAEPRDGTLILASDIEIYAALSAGAQPATRELKADDTDANRYRLELLRQLSTGQRLELVVKRALTYKQSTHRGKLKNRNSLRFSAKGEDLATLAPTWKGQPFLVDHNTHEQSARKGTILTSELGDYRGAAGFYMGFSVVKPDAVQSVLDGTLDRFSIGWFPGGPVLCTAHEVDVRSKHGCVCWPGDTVEINGETREVEYEYHQAEGKELSGVNIPAVKSTKIEEYRAALTAELNLPRRTAFQVPATLPEENPMKFARLAAALALSALDETQEEAAVTAVTTLTRRAATAEQERDTARTQLADVTAKLTAALAAVATAGAARLDAVIADGIRVGKIPVTRNAAGEIQQGPMERRLRKIGAEAGGVAQVEAELADLPSIVPVQPGIGAPQSARVAPPSVAPVLAAGGQPLTVEQFAQHDPLMYQHFTSFAAASGVKVEDMIKTYLTQGRA